jgi:O-antigen ligase
MIGITTDTRDVQAAAVTVTSCRSQATVSPTRANRAIASFRKLIAEPLWSLGTIWPLVLLVPHLPGLPTASVNVLPWRQEATLSLLLTITIALLVRTKANTREVLLSNKREFILAGLFVIWIWLSIVWANDRYPAAHLAMQWTSYLTYFALMTFVARARVIRSSFVMLGLVVWILALACLIESWMGAPLTDASLRYGQNPLFRGFSGFGEIMGSTSILFAALAIDLRRARVALICGATAALAWLATLQSLERAPLIGASAGLALLSIGVLLKSSRGRVLRLGLLSFAFAFMLFLTTSPSGPTQGDVATVSRLQQSLGEDANTQVRFLFWGVALELWRDHPILGVGASNYQARYAHGRAEFAARYPGSALVKMTDHLRTLCAHNEYLQMLAELGTVGLLLFTLFAVGLVQLFFRALKLGGRSIPILGAAGAMLAFVVSSGASSSSFRYLGGGIVFFFSAALIGRCVQRYAAERPRPTADFGSRTFKWLGRGLAALIPISLIAFTVQAAGTTFQGYAETSTSAAQSEGYYQTSLRLYPSNAAALFGYGMFLYTHQRPAESLPYLRSAMEKGFNTSTCFAYLAGAEATTGDLNAAERTLATAVKVYPTSVFLRTRHATALERKGQGTEAKYEFAKALELDARGARGWQRLIEDDIDAATLATTHDRGIAMPGELVPQAGVFAILQENEYRFPEMVHTGWRTRMLSGQAR